MSSSHLNVYEVEIKERARYVVRVLARTAGEACRKAGDSLIQSRGVAKPWSLEPLDCRVEAVLQEKASREDTLR